MRNRKIDRLARLFVFCGAVLLPGAVSAQMNSDFALSLGWFPTTFSTSARLSADNIPGSDVDLEDDLGLDAKVSNIRLDGFWRFKPKHRFEFGYTSWRRSAEKSIDQGFQWGDKYFKVGADVKATNNAQFIKLAYRYSLYRTDTTEFDVSGGFDTIWNKTKLSGEATVIDENGVEHTGEYEQRNDFVAPAPVFGVSISHLPRERWLLRGSLEYFQATVNNTTGKVLDGRGSVDYLFKPKYGVGLGYNWVGYRIERSRFDVSYDFNGPVLYFSYRR